MNRKLAILLIVGIQYCTLMSCASYYRFEFAKQENVVLEAPVKFELVKKRDKAKPKSFYYKIVGILFFSIDHQIRETYLGTVYLNGSDASYDSWKKIDKITVRNDRDGELFSYTTEYESVRTDVAIDSNRISFPFAVNKKCKSILVSVYLFGTSDGTTPRIYRFRYNKIGDRYFGPVFFG